MAESSLLLLCHFCARTISLPFPCSSACPTPGYFTYVVQSIVSHAVSNHPSHAFLPVVPDDEDDEELVQYDDYYQGAHCDDDEGYDDDDDGGGEDAYY